MHPVQRLGLTAVLQVATSFLLSPMIQDHLPDFTDSSVLECRTSEHSRCPSMPVWCKHPQGSFILTSRTICFLKILSVSLVDHYAVNHLDDTALDALEFVAGSGDQQEQKKVGH